MAATIYCVISCGTLGMQGTAAEITVVLALLVSVFTFYRTVLSDRVRLKIIPLIGKKTKKGIKIPPQFQIINLSKYPIFARDIYLIEKHGNVINDGITIDAFATLEQSLATSLLEPYCLQLRQSLTALFNMRGNLNLIKDDLVRICVVLTCGTITHIPIKQNGFIRKFLGIIRYIRHGRFGIPMD